MKKKTYNDTYDDMLEEIKQVLVEQVQYLKNASTKGKLSFSDSQKLFALVKHLQSLAREEFELANQLSDEDLERIMTAERVFKHSKKRKEQENESLSENSSENAEITPEESE